MAVASCFMYRSRIQVYLESRCRVFQRRTIVIVGECCLGLVEPIFCASVTYRGYKRCTFEFETQGVFRYLRQKRSCGLAEMDRIVAEHRNGVMFEADSCLVESGQRRLVFGNGPVADAYLVD